MPTTLKERPHKETEKEITMKSSSSENRVHISFPDGMKKRLENIKDDSELMSLSEVFREAFKFYALAYEEHKKGSEFLIRDKNGQLERLRMFL